MPGLGLDAVPAKAQAVATSLVQQSGLANTETAAGPLAPQPELANTETATGPLAPQPELANTETATGPLAPQPGLADTGVAGAEALIEIVRRRAADLMDYQSDALASQYVDFVDAASAREREVMGDRTELASAVARHLYKLTAYKDEYEVARLHLRPGLRDAMREAVGDYDGYRILLHPPVLRALGLKRKISLGPFQRPVLGLLKAMRRLRGTRLDVFGYAKVRRVERELIAEYRALMEAELDALTPDSYERALQLARLPDRIRGYEDVKLAGVERFREQMRAIRSPDSRPVALTSKPTS